MLLSGEIPFSPIERPNTEAARIFYSAPNTPPILPVGKGKISDKLIYDHDMSIVNLNYDILVYMCRMLTCIIRLISLVFISIHLILHNLLDPQSWSVAEVMLWCITWYDVISR